MFYVFKRIIRALFPEEKKLPDLRCLGNECDIMDDVSFGSEPYLISIGNHVRIANGVRFFTHDGGMWVLRMLYPDLKNADLFGQISVGDNVHIGARSTILPGVTIGNNVIVACGAIVTKNVPDNSVVAGIPARVIESIEEYMEKHKEDIELTKALSPKEKKEYLLKKYN